MRVREAEADDEVHNKNKAKLEEVLVERAGMREALRLQEQER